MTISRWLLDNLFPPRRPDGSVRGQDPAFLALFAAVIAVSAVALLLRG